VQVLALAPSRTTALQGWRFVRRSCALPIALDRSDVDEALSSVRSLPQSL
jgi:hypothetical protein